METELSEPQNGMATDGQGHEGCNCQALVQSPVPKEEGFGPSADTKIKFVGVLRSDTRAPESKGVIHCPSPLLDHNSCKSSQGLTLSAVSLVNHNDRQM